MTQTELNGYRMQFVTVPEGATDFDLPEQDNGSVLQYKANNRWNTDTIEPGDWVLMGIASEVKDEQIPDGMVEEDEADWHREGKRLETLLSFVRSQGCEPEKTVLLYEPKK